MSKVIAKHKRRDQILAQLDEGSIGVSEAAKEFGVEYHILWKYLRDRTGTPIADSVSSLDEKITMLREVLEKVKDNVEGILVSANTGEGLRYGPNWIRELRNLVGDLAKLQRQIVESPTVLIQNVVQTQTMMQTFLLQSLCPNCKGKLIEFLEKNR